MDRNDLWKIVPTASINTNCIMPKYILNACIRNNTMLLPLLFKIVNPKTNEYTICAADEFYDTEVGDRLVILPQIIIDYLKLDTLVSVKLINHNSNLIPPKAKLIYLRPQNDSFYQTKNIQKILEQHFCNSYIYGQNYLIEIKNEDQVIPITVANIIDRNNNEVKFADINNIELNIEFLPIEQKSQINDQSLSAEKKLATEQKLKTNKKIPIEQKSLIDKNLQINQKLLIDKKSYTKNNDSLPIERKFNINIDSISTQEQSSINNIESLIIQTQKIIDKQLNTIKQSTVTSSIDDQLNQPLSDPQNKWAPFFCW